GRGEAELPGLPEALEHAELPPTLPGGELPPAGHRPGGTTRRRLTAESARPEPAGCPAPSGGGRRGGVDLLAAMGAELDAAPAGGEDVGAGGAAGSHRPPLGLWVCREA